MAKRTDEKPFRPLETSLVQSVMYGSPAVASNEPVEEAPKTITLTRPIPASPERPAQQPDVVDEGQGPVLHAILQERPRIAVRRPQPPQASTHAMEERMDREKRVLLTASEERTLERVVANIGAELGTSLKLSHVLRSCIRLVINAENELVDRARATGRTTRPPNGDLPAIEAFEKIIAGVLQSGIRAARQIR